MNSLPAIGNTIYERAIILDAGPLISIYDPQDKRGDSIQELIKRLQQRQFPLYITLLTISEAHNRILQDVNKQRALEFLNDIMDGSVHILRMQDDDDAKIVNIISRYQDQTISFTDAAVMVLMMRNHIQKVLTYDWHFNLLNFIVINDIQNNF